MTLDGYPPLTFNVHGVKDLIPELTIINKMGKLDQAVGKGRLSVINMSDDAEITYFLHVILVFRGDSNVWLLLRLHVEVVKTMFPKFLLVFLDEGIFFFQKLLI